MRLSLASPVLAFTVSVAAALAVAPAALADEPSAAAIESCPVRERWPGDAWPSRAEQSRGNRATEIAALEKYAFTLDGADADRKGVRTDAVLIIQGGEVVYERYARGFDASKKHLTWSVSKSLTGALVGVAVQEGLLATSDSICKTIPDLPPASCAVTVEHLLEMGSGFDWKEIYEDESNQESSTLALLYGQGSGDGGRFNASHALREAPGTSWLYSTGDTCTLAKVVGAAMREKYGALFPWPALFDRIGARHVTLERDAAGEFVGGSYWYATARDAARLGYLYLNDGCWNGQRILPAGWVSAAVEVNPAFKAKRHGADATDVYGRLWWLNQAVPEAGVAKPYPDLPDDLFMAQGHWGQTIAVIPSLDLVIVRFADDRDHVFDRAVFEKLAIAVGRAP